MPADVNDATLKRPARVPFRQRLPAVPAGPQAAAPAELRFAPQAEAPGTDRDVLIGYQLFLGRDPENSFVIAEAKRNPLRVFISGLAGSGEFQVSVLQALMRRQAMPHERNAVRPAAEQIDWLTRLLTMPADLASGLREAADWRGFWTALIGLPGFPRGAETRAELPEDKPDAASADAGFILITIDNPKPGETLHPGALLNGAGWAIAPADVAEIQIALDDRVLTQARYGLPRPDVARNFPHYRHADHCGFSFSVQVPEDAAVTPGSALNVVLRTVDGQTGQRGVRVAAPARRAAEAPSWPIRMFVEDVRVNAEGELRLRGWALSHAGIAGITVSLRDEVLGQAELGLLRSDIGETYPDYPEAAASGFVFAARLAGHAAGQAPVRVHLTDAAGQQRQVIVPVTVPELAARPKPAGAGAAPEARFHCDSATVAPSGQVTINGWALVPGGVREIGVFRGRKKLAAAALGRKRADIARAFPDAPGAAESGYRCAFRPDEALGAGDEVILRLRGLDGGALTLKAVLTSGLDDAGVTPSPAAAPPPVDLGGGTRLEIDKPVLAEDAALMPVHGALTISGWAVAQSGIAEVVVHCDGKKLDRAYIGMRREDIARAFPDCADSLRAGFALVLPAGSVPVGERHFSVAASSRDGHIETRHFKVTVEPPDEASPGSTHRLCMPRAEQALMEACLAARDCHPEFLIALLPGEGEAETRASLDRQAYRRFTVFSAPEEAPSRGDLVMVLRAGDVLGCDALLEFATALATDPDTVLIYGDEVRPDPAHPGPSGAFFKPDWSPELLLNMDYLGPVWCAAASALPSAGLTIAGLLETSRYGAALRLAGAAGRRVRHINKVLGAAGRLTSSAEAAEAIGAMASRLTSAITFEPGRLDGIWRARRPGPARGLTSIIIPTAGKGGLVRRAIASIRETTAPGSVEIVVLDNVPAADRATKAWLKKNAELVIDEPGAFNWSRFNNAAARQARGEFLLFMNDDIEARAPGWLEALLEQAARPEVAVVGARLLYPDGKVQHGGQYLADTHARHAFRFAAGDDPGPFGLAAVTREVAAVTGACQMVRRDVFDRLSGFDEAHDVVNNDLDFCLRAQAAGLSVVYTPHVELMHHELASRAAIEDSYDASRFTGDWRISLLRGDPFHSRRLLADADHYAPDPEPVLPVHAGPAGPALASIRRILAVKLDHIGDFITALPAIRALAARFPQASVSVLVAPASAVIARVEPSIADIIEFPFFHARSADGQRAFGETELGALRERLAAGRFDMAIDLRMQPQTREVLQWTGAPFLVGYDHAGAFPWLDVSMEWEGDQRLLSKHAHISERLLVLVDAAVAACRDIAPASVPPVRDAASVPALARLPEAFLAKRLVCIHPGVGNPVRQWPAAHFAALIDLLAAEEDMHAVIVGGGDEQGVAEEVLRHVSARDRAVSLAGMLKLAELREVMAACALFVGNNSGPKHIAAALGLPVLGIHSGVVDAAEWAPLGGAAMALQRRMICGPCYLEFASDCPRGLACLTGIKPRDALAMCRRLLATRRADPRDAPTIRSKIRRRK